MKFISAKETLVPSGYYDYQQQIIMTHFKPLWLNFYLFWKDTHTLCNDTISCSIYTSTCCNNWSRDQMQGLNVNEASSKRLDMLFRYTKHLKFRYNFS